MKAVIFEGVIGCGKEDIIKMVSKKTCNEYCLINGFTGTRYVSGIAYGTLNHSGRVGLLAFEQRTKDDFLLVYCKCKESSAKMRNDIKSFSMNSNTIKKFKRLFDLYLKKTRYKTFVVSTDAPISTVVSDVLDFLKSHNA